VLQILGIQYSQLGELQIALNYHSRAIQIAKSLGDRHQEATLLLGLGGVHKDSGNFQKALDNYSQARKIFASLSSRHGTLYTSRDLLTEEDRSNRPSTYTATGCSIPAK